jgi:hypothetical protein
MINDLILRVSNVERKCAMTCLVSDAQDRPLERVGVEVNVCGGCASQNHPAWQGHEPHNRSGETTEGTATTTECMQPPVG